MSEGRAISRKEFLHGIFRHVTGNGDCTGPAPEAPEPDYLSMLPPEFSGAMLDMEAARLGGDTAKMTRNEKAALVVQAMYGKTNRSVQGQQDPGPEKRHERESFD